MKPSYEPNASAKEHLIRISRGSVQQMEAFVLQEAEAVTIPPGLICGARRRLDAPPRVTVHLGLRLPVCCPGNHLPAASTGFGRGSRLPLGCSGSRARARVHGKRLLLSHFLPRRPSGRAMAFVKSASILAEVGIWSVRCCLGNRRQGSPCSRR